MIKNLYFSHLTFISNNNNNFSSLLFIDSFSHAIDHTSNGWKIENEEKQIFWKSKEQERIYEYEAK
jgi:hypothetical protein